jgi:uncharacterized membrane protein YdbT with pleckstrin-like domain
MPEETGAPSWVTLTSDERIIWKGHPSIWLVSWMITISVGIIGLGVIAFLLFENILRLLAIIPIAIGIVFIVRAYLSHWSVYYILTTEEVYKKTGLLSRSVINIRLDRIQNTSFTQSFIERLMKYGTIEIDTAGTGGTELVLYAVPKPEEVNGQLTEQLDAIKPQPEDQPA